MLLGRLRRRRAARAAPPAPERRRAAAEPASSGAEVLLVSGERLRVQEGASRLQALLDRGGCGRVGLKLGDGRWRWVSLADVRRVEPRH